MGRSKRDVPDVTNYESIIDGLKTLYKRKIRPLEELYKFDLFHSAHLTDTDIAAKPFILVLGQYSVGKSSFVQYLLDRDYPGCHIGPEPTTDKFVAIMNGAADKIIPGNAACIASDLPFTGMSKFGVGFMSKFQVAQVPVPFLENVTIIDTPGVLSGEKQRIGRAYDFVEVCEWFADRADLIILLFDAHKLDISDEFKSVITTLKPHSDKMARYGALMWSFGKVMDTPEVVRVYVGSFWNNANKDSDNYPLLIAEQADLLSDLRDLPRNAAVRKINEIVKRARLAKIHAIIIGHLKSQMPAVFGKSSKQQELIDNLDEEFLKIQRQYRFAVGDFPDIQRFRNNLKVFNIAEFAKLNTKLIAMMDEVLSEDLPKLMNMFPQGNPTLADHLRNPFADFIGTDDSSAGGEVDLWSWSSVERSRHAIKFQELNPIDGKISGAVARPVLMESELPIADLSAVWGLADLNRDGYMDCDEFSLAMHLIKIRKMGTELPKTLPESLLPLKGKI